MRHRSIDTFKEEYHIINCVECGKELKTPRFGRKYCFDCGKERKKLSRRKWDKHKKMASGGRGKI
jgi:hypothetical protein